MDFVAIDFETANRHRTSACSLGVAIVEDNAIVQTKEWLIKPYPYEFEPFYVRIHEITADSVDTAPSFAEIWDDLYSLLNNSIVVAHNAVFDMSVLRSAVEHYQLTAPNIDILCTYRLAQSMFPAAGAYRLDVICKLLNIDLNHHCACSDAKASAQIVLKAMESASAFDISSLTKAYSLSNGFWGSDHCYEPCRRESITLFSNTELSSDNKSYVSDNKSYIDEDFLDKNFVFTGTLLSMPRSSAHKIVVAGGGTAQPGITKSTDYLVVGMTDYSKLAGKSESSKLRKARSLREQGHKIIIIAEDEFINMIDEELYHRCLGGSLADLPNASFLCTREDFCSQADDMTALCNALMHSLDDICEFENLPSGTVSTRSIKEGQSIMLGSALLCRVCSAKQEQVLLQLPSRFENAIREYGNIAFASENAGFISMQANTQEERALCCYAIRIAMLVSLDAYPKDFDCCNMFYIKDGSCCDAKRCISKHKDFALGCGYKHKLRRGIYYIGKNRNIVSQDTSNGRDQWLLLK